MHTDTRTLGHRVRQARGSVAIQETPLPATGTTRSIPNDQSNPRNQEDREGVGRTPTALP